MVRYIVSIRHFLTLYSVTFLKRIAPAPGRRAAAPGAARSRRINKENWMRSRVAVRASDTAVPGSVQAQGSGGLCCR